MRALGGNVAWAHACALACATLTLCAWWALWSLADYYLLPYSPWSELVVFVAAVSVYVAAYGCEALCLRRESQRYARQSPDVAEEREPANRNGGETAVAIDTLIE